MNLGASGFGVCFKVCEIHGKGKLDPRSKKLLSLIIEDFIIMLISLRLKYNMVAKELRMELISIMRMRSIDE